MIGDPVSLTIRRNIERPSKAIMKAFAVGAASAIVVWVVAWLVVVCAALVWWFFIDRLRDISRAIKGQ